jgi:type IV secretory pathway VirB10-like protein
MPDERPADAAPVIDRRPVPRGVLPRGVQTWLMAAVAAGILLIILITGHPEPSVTPRPTPGSALPPSSDRIRDYQERLRMLDEQAARQARESIEQSPQDQPRDAQDERQRPPDPIAEERRRREYESLFAGNVVISRRPDGRRPDDGASTRTSAAPTADAPQSPSLDDVAAAVVRASGGRVGGPSVRPAIAAVESPAAGSASAPQRTEASRTGPVDPTATMQRVLEGTAIDAVLTNRLDGSAAAPVVCLVTNPVYSHSGQHVLIPAGARVIGETRPTENLGETRLAVGFHRILMPDGSSISIEQFRGLNQLGDSGLRDRVNHHYWSTFGAAAAVGLVSGLSQLVATAGLGHGDGDRTVIVAGNATDATSQASAQVMNRFLNRLPTVTIREGHRVKIYVTSDLDLPEWRSPMNTHASRGGE